jgi:chromosome segregation ATPase
MQSDVSSQAKSWSQYASEIDKSETAVKELKASMTGYKDAIVKIASQNKVAFSPETTKALKELDKVLTTDGKSAEECAQAFEEFKAALGNDLHARITTLDDSIEDLD